MKQNWSRRELEAFGEPLGDSVTQRKLGGGYICGGGGKGGGGGGSPPPPATQTVTQTAIPEYARPYVETMLGKTEALTDINQNPYQAYGGQRIAGFNPTQERAFQNVANQQVAGQVGAGTALAGTAGLGSIGTANQLGQVGQQYANQVTNPYAQQAYMSPYMQNVVDVQKNEALRDAQMRNVGANLGAARQGTYGGARQVLAEQERNRNLQQQMANIQATGTQNAFQAAQQAQQYGAGLGLQGLQGQLAGYGQAGQLAGTLGQLGQTQFGQQQAITQGLQNVGAVQQAQAQQGLDMAYQDFLKQRNYPYQQLAFMSDMTRGLPLSQAAQQVYTAPPSAASQLGGLGMSALGIYGMSGGFKGASGGLPKDFKSYAKGGLAYATGGDIKTMTTDQLESLLENPGLTPLEVDMVEKQLMVRRRMAMNPESDQIMAPALRSGIASIATGEMVPEEMAGGGIVAFAGQGPSVVKDKPVGSGEARQNYRETLEKEVLDSIKSLKTYDPFKESRAQEADIRAEMAESKRVAPYRALAMTGLGTMAGTSQNPLSNLGLGGIEGLKSYSQSMREQEDARKLLLQQGVEREKSKFARETGLLGAQQTALGQLYGKEAALEQAKATAGATAVSRGTLDLSRAQTTYNTLLANARAQLTAGANKIGTSLHKKYKGNPEQIEIDAQNIALENLSPDLRQLLKLKTVNIPNPQDPGAAPAPGKPSATKTPVKVTTPQERDKLPKGTQYIDPNGVLRIKS
jgi:hypothetical protein